MHRGFYERLVSKVLALHRLRSGWDWLSRSLALAQYKSTCVLRIKFGGAKILLDADLLPRMAISHGSHLLAERFGSRFG
jgi:hypothetical protein